MARFQLDPKRTALLVIDMQDKILSPVERLIDLFEAVQKMVQGAKELSLPILASLLSPKRFGPITASCSDLHSFARESFSCYREEEIEKEMKKTGRNQWILAGAEAHISLLQSARDLLVAGFDVVVLNDATSSRSIFDYSTAIAEMRDMGARISSVEIVLFELLQGIHHPKAEAMSGGACSSCCSMPKPLQDLDFLKSNTKF